MRLLKYKVSLVPRKQIDLFEEKTPDFVKDERSYYLRSIFTNNVTFNVKDKLYTYIPRPVSDAELNYISEEDRERLYIFQVERAEKVDRVIVGSIGGQRGVNEFTSPSEGLIPIERLQWQAIAIAVDLDDSPQGQILYIEKTPKIGTINKILDSLVSKINNNMTSKFEISINPIIDADDFWNWVSKTGLVTKIRIKVSTPNGLGIKSTFNSEAQAAKDALNANEFSSEYKNSAGLHVEKEYLKEPVEYASKGGGVITATAKGKPGYDSRNRAAELRLPVEKNNEKAVEPQILVNALVDNKNSSSL